MESFPLIEHNTALCDGLHVDRPPERVPSEWSITSPTQLPELSVTREQSHLSPSRCAVDMTSAVADQSWVSLGMTAHDVASYGLNALDNPDLWTQDFFPYEPNSSPMIVSSDHYAHSFGYLDLDTFLPEPYYSASAPTPERSWESPWPQYHPFHQAADSAPPWTFPVRHNALSTSPCSWPPKAQVDTFDESKIRITTSMSKPERWRCSEQSCSKYFTLRKDLKRHIRAVHNHERLECPIPNCSQATRGFSRKDKLKSHMKIHRITESEPFKPTCSSSAAESPAIAASDMTNRTTSNVPEKVASGDGARGNREADIKELQPRVCPVAGCRQTFVNQHDLTRHERTIHVEPNSGSGYRCAFEACSKRDKIWNRVDNFKKHLREQHKLEDVQPVVDRSSRTNTKYHANAPFNITTLDAFSKKMHLG
jgi:hypothetical protein